MALRVAPLTLLLILTTAPAALAAEALPGESCAGLDSGTYRQSSGPEVPGAGHLLVCDGANWQPVLSYNDDGEITTIGNQSCGNGDVLTFNSVIWTCGAGGGGSGLFEKSGTLVRPNSAAVAIATDDFVFGSHSLDDVAGTADDSRMYFDKSKGAFRAGHSTNANWNASGANVGTNSVAFGRNTIASGTGSMAFGGDQHGDVTITASGGSSLAFGTGNDSDSFITASGTGSFAAGIVNYNESIIASGSGSYARGVGNITASGEASTAWGGFDNTITASGDGSTAWGDGTIASGRFSTAWGNGSHAGSYLETSLGRYPLNTAGNATSWAATDTLFEIGNGASSAARANAVTVLKNGNVGIGTAEPQSGLHIPEGQFLQAAHHRHGGPIAGECNQDYFGRQILDTSSYRLHICLGNAGWFYAPLTMSPVMP